MKIQTGRRLTRPVKLAAAMAAVMLTITAHAANLPPPPVSPAPVTDYEYDAKGNRTRVIQAKTTSGFNFVTKNTYDPLDRLKTNTDPKNGVTTLGYNGQDQLTQVTDPRNLVTSYQLNGLGDMTQLASPDTGTATSTYDASGNLKTRTDSRGVLATYTYDNLNRLKSVVYSKSGQTSQTYTWTYDQAGGDFGYGVGRLTSSTFPGGNTKYGYDADGRQITNIQTVGSVVLTTRYSYDIAGNVKTITYPSGRVLSIDYVNGKPSALSWAKDAGSTPQPLISQIQWEPFGGVRSWAMHVGSGTKLQERSYDQWGRLVRYPLGEVVRDLRYDAADRIVNYTHLDANTGAQTATTQAMEQTFGYDQMGRLSQIMLPQTSWTIGYDANGNRTSVVQEGVTQVYTTAATSNRLMEISNPARTFQHDAAGNTVVDTQGYTSTYGLDNRMATITKAGVTTAYVYNAEGQRLRKTVGTSPKLFAYDPSGQIIGEYGSNGASQKEYIWLGNTPIAVHQPSTTEAGYLYYVYTDHLNAPRILIGSTSGAMRWRWLSEPFGSLAPEENPLGYGAVSLNLRFPGQYFDHESKLFYNYFRDYDSTVGGYIQSDPLGLGGGGTSTYGYVNGNPLSNIDPVGLACTSVGGKNGRTYCSYPNGPSFNVPTPPGFPEHFDSESRFYHNYDVMRELGQADPRCVMAELRKNPTPGNSNGASANGIVNEAKVGPLDNPVISYVTNDTSSGSRLIVNITFNNGAFADGYVARGVVGNTVHTWGEGTAVKQSPNAAGWPGRLAQYVGNEMVWGGQMDEIIKKCSCQK